MATTALWTAITINTVLVGISLEAQTWIPLLGQGASLALLGYVAWKIHKGCRKDN